jgi:hypothetical protein
VLHRRSRSSSDIDPLIVVCRWTNGNRCYSYLANRDHLSCSSVETVVIDCLFSSSLYIEIEKSNACRPIVGQVEDRHTRPVMFSNESHHILDIYERMSLSAFIFSIRQVHFMYRWILTCWHVHVCRQKRWNDYLLVYLFVIRSVDWCQAWSSIDS